jgi:hypothetical protein
MSDIPEDIPENFVVDPKELSMILSIMLKASLVEKIGPERLETGGGTFSYVVPMENTETGEDDTFMISYDENNRFLMERVEKGEFPEYSIIFFNDDKESAIMNAAIHGDGFMLDGEETEKGPETFVDPDDHFSDPEVP